MNHVLEPILNDAVTRFTKFNKPEVRDAIRILGPALEAICLDAKEPGSRASEWLQAQAPELITRESVDGFVRDVTEAPAHVLAAARAKQQSLERELANQRPLTAREQVLAERLKPLSERSFESIQAEQFEVNSGHIRVEDAESHSGFTRGQKLPDVVWARMPHTDAELQRELDRRECAAYGVEYRQPVAKLHHTASIPAMRG